MLKILSLFTAIIAGSILPLAFAPFGYYLIAELSLILLLITWNKNPKQVFLSGWLFGLAFFGFGVSWIYISIHDFGKAPAGLAILILGILISFLALYPALVGYLLTRFFPKNTWHKFIITFPLLWVLSELVRGWLLSGFPWLFLGYGHINSTLSGWATVFGVYGVSFFIAQTAGIITYIYLKILKKTQAKKKACAYLICNWIGGIILILLIMITWLTGYYLANSPNNLINKNKLIQVSLIQGNTSPDQKWDEYELASILDLYYDLTIQNLSSKLIIWPEAAIPAYPDNIKSYLNQLTKIAKKNNLTVLTGIPIYNKDTKNYYNSIITLGKNPGVYHKRHLVPFGEYLPLKFMLSWLHNYLDIPMSGFTDGHEKQSDLIFNLDNNNIIIAPFICYEIAYSSLVLDYLPRAGLLVTICDDSWFGESIAAAQHLEIAQMRSLETNRYQLLSTTTGITAIIGNKGKIISKLPTFTQGVLTGNIKILSGATPWVKLHLIFR